MALAYLVSDCQLSSEEGRRQLRSADSRTCVVRRTYSNFIGADVSRLLAQVCGTAFPAGLRQTDIGYEQFKPFLKTYLFER